MHSVELFAGRSVLSLSTADYGARINTITVTGVTEDPALPPKVPLELPVYAPVDADGRFGGSWNPQGIALVTAEGRFEGRSVAGSFRVERDGAVECGGTFEADLVPVEPFERTFEMGFGLIDGCGEVHFDENYGLITIVRSADRLSVLSIAVDGEDEEGNQTLAGSATYEPGGLPLSDETGEFGPVSISATIGGETIVVNGELGGLDVRVSVQPAPCPTPDSHDQVDVLTEGPGFDYVLPTVGSGPSQHPGRAPVWPLFAVGAAAAAAALALRSRRS